MFIPDVTEGASDSVFSVCDFVFFLLLLLRPQDTWLTSILMNNVSTIIFRSAILQCFLCFFKFILSFLVHRVSEKRCATIRINISKLKTPSHSTRPEEKAIKVVKCLHFYQRQPFSRKAFGSSFL